MRRFRMLTATISTVVSVAASAALAAPASAAADSLSLSLTDQYHGTKTVTLTCDPTGGTHPYADGACTALSAVNGQIAQIPPEQGAFCTADYDPTTATATGDWDGYPIDYRQAFTNICDADVETGGHVFNFWYAVP